MYAIKTIRNSVLRMGIWMTVAIMLPLCSFSDDGTWTNLTGGAWSTAGNWLSGTVAGGTDAIADFSTLNITASTFVNNDAPRTVGTLRFGDTTPGNDWTLTNSTLTLAVSSGTPAITVANQTATISAVLQGIQGLVKNGTGTLTLSGRNTVAGNIAVNQGMLINTFGGLRDTTGSVIVSPGATLYTRSGWGANDGRYEMTNSITLSGTGKDATYGALHGLENFACNGKITLLTDSKITQDWNNFYLNGAISGTDKNLILGAANAPSQPGLSVNGSMSLGSGALSVIGYGYVMLNASNSFGGGTTVSIGSSGSLKLGHVNGLGTGGLTVNSGVVDLNTKNISIAWLSGTGGVITDSGAAGTTTQTVSQATDTVYSGAVTNGALRTVLLKKRGLGTLTLVSTNNNFNSPVAVEEGRVLVASGGRNSGAVTVSTGAAFGLKATNISPWLGGSVTYSDNTALPLDLGMPTMVPGLSPVMNISNLTFNGMTTLSVTGGLWVVTGTYPLLGYSGTWLGTMPVLGSLPNGLVATLVHNTGKKTLDLQVSAVPSFVPSSTTAWTNLVSGNAAGTWGVSANWNNGVASGVDVLADFSTLNIATNSRVVMESPRTVGKLYVSDVTPTVDRYWEIDASTNNHLTLASSAAQPEICVTNTQLMLGGIEGSNGLVKTGNGTLLIYGDGYSNKLSGPIVVKNGYLATAGLLPFKGISSDIFVLDGAAFEANQSFDTGSFTNNFYLSGRGGTATYYCNGYTPDGVRYDGETTPFGALDLHGNVTIDGKVTLLGDTRITHGFNDATFNKPISAEGSGKNLELAITQGNQGALAFTGTSSLNIGAGILTVNGMVSGAAQVRYYSDSNVITCNGGLIVTNFANLILWYGSPTTLTVSGGVLLAGTNMVFDLARSSLNIPYLAGNGRLTLSRNTAGTSIVTLNQTGDYEFSGTADESSVNGGSNASATRPLAFVKNGSGKWTVSGTNNTYHGATTVNGGELRITGKLLNSDVVVTNGAAFSGNGGLVKSLNFASNSVFKVSVNSTATEQTTVSGAVTIEAGARLVASGDYSHSVYVAILKAAGGITGTFVKEGLPLGAQVTYTSNEVRLTIVKGTVITFK